MVESSGLLNRRTVKSCTESSNLSLSARHLRSKLTSNLGLVIQCHVMSEQHSAGRTPVRRERRPARSLIRTQTLLQFRVRRTVCTEVIVHDMLKRDPGILDQHKDAGRAPRHALSVRHRRAAPRARPMGNPPLPNARQHPDMTVSSQRV